MIHIRLGKRQGLADKTRQSLPQGIIPTFRVGGLTAFFANAVLFTSIKHLLVGRPEVAEDAAAIGFWNLIPQTAASFDTAVANHKGDNLPGAATNSGPQPAFLRLFQHKRP